MTFLAILILYLTTLSDARNFKKMKEWILRQSHEEDQIDFIILRQIWPEPTCLFPGVINKFILTIAP